MTAEQRIRELEQRLEDLRARLPKHSVPAAMILELEAMEDELAALRGQSEGNSSTSSSPAQPSA
ncbi:MAG: hypothetical protein QHH80_05290 [Anaerolineae bacterium]|nr:hypothetical protein [Anaerolineae bacterium]